MTDLIAARVDFGSFLGGTTKGLVQDGKLKALAIVQDKRSALMPEVPTTEEQGFPGLIGGVHFLLFAPEARQRTSWPSRALHYKVIGDPYLKERFLKIGFEPTPMHGPEEVTAAMRQTADAMRANHQAAEHQAGLTRVAPRTSVVISWRCQI